MIVLHVAARSKAWVCNRSLAGIVGLNPAFDYDRSLLLCSLWEKEMKFK